MDDRKKNGIKPEFWGSVYWEHWKTMSIVLNNFSPELENFVRFVMQMPKDIVPCLPCRKGAKVISSSSEYNLEVFLQAKCLPEYVNLFHEAVNHKLGKPLYGHPPRQSLLRYLGQKESPITTGTLDICDPDHPDYSVEEDFKPLTLENCFGGGDKSPPCPPFEGGRIPPLTPRERGEPPLSPREASGMSGSESKGFRRDVPRFNESSSRGGKGGIHPPLFWSWIRSIAFNFPADIRLDDYWNGDLEHKFTYPDGSDQQMELQRRLNSYITFFDLLNNFIDRGSDLYRRWSKAYILNTPTPMTFASRTQLLGWIFKMHKACGYRFPCHTCTDTSATTTGGSDHDAQAVLEQEQTFVEMVEQLHFTRSLAVKEGGITRSIAPLSPPATNK